jgi:hypothetical protein
MTSFALISEGITDQAIIENILDCISEGSAITRALRPLRDETDKSRSAKNEFSKWELVLDYIKSEEMLDAIQTNDFVVIQMDTDQCEHVNFGISLLNEGKPKVIRTLISECTNHIKSMLHADFPSTELYRLIFAIPVLSTEYWLVSLHDGTHAHTTKTAIACSTRLLNLLGKKSIPYRKDYETYSKLSRGFRRKKILSEVAIRTPCLQIFVDQVSI